VANSKCTYLQLEKARNIGNTHPWQIASAHPAVRKGPQYWKYTPVANSKCTYLQLEKACNIGNTHLARKILASCPLDIPKCIYRVDARVNPFRTDRDSHIFNSVLEHAEYTAVNLSAQTSPDNRRREPSIVYARAASQQGSYLVSIVIDLPTRYQ
jgi:hypothetical protein